MCLRTVKLGGTPLTEGTARRTHTTTMTTLSPPDPSLISAR